MVIQILSLIMSLSALGNVLTVLFTQGRGESRIYIYLHLINGSQLVIQELGREGILPYSSFFASNEPFQAPLPGLFALWLVSSVIMISVPPGDAFSFMLNCKHRLGLHNASVSTLFGNSAVVYLSSDKRSCRNRASRLVHAGIQGVALESTLQSIQMDCYVFFACQPVSRFCSICTTFARHHVVCSFAVLGE